MISMKASWPKDVPTPPAATYGLLILGSDHSHIVRSVSFLRFPRRPTTKGSFLFFDLTVVDGITEEFRRDGAEVTSYEGGMVSFT